MSEPGADFAAIESALKRALAILREADVDVALAGSIAAWARGGPQSCNDIDLLVRPGDADRALQALADAGLQTERAPEGWLVKARDGDVLIDLIFAPNGAEDVEPLFAHAEELRPAGIPVRVMAIEDMLTAKLRSFNEHYLDFADTLQIVRALREQIDFEELRRRTGDSPYAGAFLHLADALGLSGRPLASSSP